MIFGDEIAATIRRLHARGLDAEAIARLTGIKIALVKSEIERIPRGKGQKKRPPRDRLLEGR